jgi:hypothetical protein
MEQKKKQRGDEAVVKKDVCKYLWQLGLVSGPVLIACSLGFRHGAREFAG